MAEHSTASHGKTNASSSAPSNRGASASSSTPKTTVWVNTPKAQPSVWWKLGRSLLTLAFLAALWGVFTHWAIDQITHQIPVLASRTVLPQVERMMESAFHGMAAWERLEFEDDTAPIASHAQRQQFGHLPYAEVSPDYLMVIGSYSTPAEQRFERMQEDAGLALLQMIDAARQDGIWIVPISGFRDYHRQKMLFQIRTEHRGTPEQAAQSVAPPGYSEHHTGMAVDLADGLARALDLSVAFGETDAFRWLSRHAHDFGFELSFPPDNPQGVQYEPWHWRFVGTPQAQRTFASFSPDLDRDLERSRQTYIQSTR